MAGIVAILMQLWEHLAACALPWLLRLPPTSTGGGASGLMHAYRFGAEG